MKKTVYFVTHGNKNPGPNPSMTDDGVEQVRKLRPQIPARPALVVCGTGRRHLDVRHALGLENAPTMWTPLVGGPESLEIISGQRMVMLANGEPPIPRARYMDLSFYGESALLIILNEVPDGTVICSGRPAVDTLTVKHAKSAAVYQVTFEDESLPLACDLNIKEVIALGETEAHPV